MIYRIHHRDRGFTQIDNLAVRDRSLSFRARGLHHWLLSHRDVARASARDLAEEGTEGRDAIAAAMNELELQGYIRRGQERDEGGRIVHVLHVYEVPPDDTEPQVRPETENPAPVARNQESDPENPPPAPGNPAPVNPAPVTRPYKKTVVEDQKEHLGGAGTENRIGHSVGGVPPETEYRKTGSMAARARCVAGIINEADRLRRSASGTTFMARERKLLYGPVGELLDAGHSASAIVQAAASTSVVTSAGLAREIRSTGKSRASEPKRSVGDDAVATAMAFLAGMKQ